MDWMRQTLGTMPGQKDAAHMYRPLSDLPKEGFDYLSERVAAQFPLRKTHIEYTRGDSFQNFINQIDTCD
ncbi:MAG TPA: hypothetical protein VHD38_00875 [Candidatus Paceibacterota bacterium]|jgi:hypothetical protein|nr:hypothetical protein [Candidatus Paceibacterota bacterium]